ncbi:MAG: hypothetical protein JXP34_24665 [Planctomycetes bacterium]|nr:hypothetical protein [Planctomycetota bacterium]
MKTAISLSDSLFEAAERLAKRLSITRSQLFQRALEAYLRDHDEERIVEALNAVYGPEGEHSRLDPVLDQLQIETLRKVEW